MKKNIRAVNFAFYNTRKSEIDFNELFAIKW